MMKKKDSNLQGDVELLGDLLFRKLSDDTEIVRLIQRIKDKGMILSIVIEANPEIDENELRFTKYDRNLLKKMKIRFDEDPD